MCQLDKLIGLIFLIDEFAQQIKYRFWAGRCQGVKSALLAFSRIYLYAQPYQPD